MSDDNGDKTNIESSAYVGTDCTLSYKSQIYQPRYTGTIKAEGFHLYGKTRKNFPPNGTVQLPSAFHCIGKLFFFFSVGNQMKRSLKTYSFRLKMLALSEGIYRQ